MGNEEWMLKAEVDVLCCTLRPGLAPVDMKSTVQGATVMTTDVNMNHDDSHKVSRGFYDQSMAQLDRMLERVPLGWQRLYAELRAGLRAARSAKRLGVGVQLNLTSTGHEWVMAKGGEDCVVEGLVRKAIRRSRSTCMCCGRLGHIRKMHGEQRVLCSVCMARTQLLHEIDDLLATCKAGHASSVSQVSGKFLTEGAHLRNFTMAACPTSETDAHEFYIGTDCRTFVEWIERVQAHLVRSVGG